MNLIVYVYYVRVSHAVWIFRMVFIFCLLYKMSWICSVSLFIVFSLYFFAGVYMKIKISLQMLTFEWWYDYIFLNFKCKKNWTLVSVFHLKTKRIKYLVLYWAIFIVCSYLIYASTAIDVYFHSVYHDLFHFVWVSEWVSRRLHKSTWNSRYIVENAILERRLGSCEMWFSIFCTFIHPWNWKWGAKM